MYNLTLSEVKKLAEQYSIIPLSKEIFGDTITPITVLQKLQNVSEHCFLFESAEDNKKWGRYSFLGFNPKMEITCLEGNLKIKVKNEEYISKENPSDFIINLLSEYKSPNFDYLPSFTGGLVGYFSYDYIKYSEPTLKLDCNDEEKFNDVDLMLFDKVIAFDHFKHKIILIVNISSKNILEEYENGIEELCKIESIINDGVPKKEAKPKLKSDFKLLFNKEKYCEMVSKAKNYIKEGDIFQVVLSNRQEALFDGSLIDSYRVLRTTNPSPYMFYLGSNDIEIVGASPETLVKLENGVLHTFPLAGTRRRGKTKQEDLELEQQLLKDEKELAEHNMLVDLGRNDLGKISKFSSVIVEKYMSILRFSHVMHIGSTVKGEILDEKTGIDAINAVLPAGTLSGAPKIRACEIINELENNKRGIYGGAIGYLDFKGNMDTCIAIRLAFKKNGKVFVRSGAGIVADSIAENEFEECENKAIAVINAIKTSVGGI